MASMVATNFDEIDRFVLSGLVISITGKNFSFVTTGRFFASLEMTG
jgi:hypothetical protein